MRLLWIALAFCTTAYGQSPADAQLIRRAQPLLGCVHQAAQFHGVSPQILMAFALHESRGDANVVVRNRNGSIDVGAFGINSVHFGDLEKNAIAPGHLLDPCISAYVAAWHYRRQVNRFGNTWAAVGAYHSMTPQHSTAYQGKIYSMSRKIDLLGIMVFTK